MRLIVGPEEEKVDFAFKVAWRYNFCGTTLSRGDLDCLRIVVKPIVF